MYIDDLIYNLTQTNPSYTYEQAKEYIIEKEKAKLKIKIEKFNKDITYYYDLNGMPKMIHFTLKDKNNIDNSVWRNCLQEYYKLYPDYKIILYDDNDIFNIIEQFDKTNVNVVKTIKKGAVLADIFRYLILYLRGGYYSDMDCFPHKRIEDISQIQYHGDDKHHIYLCNTNDNIIKSECEFYKNPCNSCKSIYTANKSYDRVQNIYRCLGHKYINEKTSIIVGYEFEETWHNELINSTSKHLYTHNDIGICQRFIGSKPSEKFFLTCYKNSIKNVINTYFNLNSTGPLFFTKMINAFLMKYDDFKDKITILPCDYFCCGSWNNKVPTTKNKFIQHRNNDWSEFMLDFTIKYK